MATLNSKLAAASIAFTQSPTVDNARKFRDASAAISQKGGNPIVWPWQVTEQTSAIMADWLAKPESSADTTIELRISGNKLVALLNAYQSLAWQVYGEETRTSETHHIVETIRDTLSEQRGRNRKA